MKRVVIQSQKEMLLEDMLIYGVVAGIDIFFDLFVNILLTLGVIKLPHEPLGHPYTFGFLQIIVLIFCAFQIFRKWRQIRYLA